MSNPGEVFVGPPAAVPAIAIIVNAADQQFEEHDPEGWAVLAALRAALGESPQGLGDYFVGPDGEVYRVVGEELADGPDAAPAGEEAST